jgi:hypothetical protein
VEENVKYKIIKNYPTIDGMLYKNEIVKLDNGYRTEDKVRVKDSTGKIWFVETKYLIKI